MTSTVISRSTLKWTGCIVGVLLALYMVVGVFWVPSYLNGRVAQVANQQYGLAMATGSHSFNPFTFRYQLNNLRINQGDSSVLTVKSLGVNFDPVVSIYRGKYTFGSVEVRSPHVDIRRDETGQLNWQTIVARSNLQSESVPESMEPPRGLAVDRFQVSDGSVTWKDQRWKRPSTINVRTIKLTARSLDYSRRETSPFSLRLQIGSGTLRAEGSVEGDERISANYSLEGFSLSTLNGALRTYIRGSIINGHLNVRGTVSGRTDGAGLTMESSGAVIDLELADNENSTIFQAQRLSAGGVRLSLDESRVEAAELAVDSPVFNLVKSSGGTMNINRLLMSTRNQADRPGGSTEAENWTFQVGPTDIRSGQVNVLDRSLAEEVSLRINDISGTTGVVSNQPGDTVIVSLRGTAPGEAPLRVNAIVTPEKPEQTLELNSRLRDLSLSPFSPYGVHYVGHRVDGGKLNLTLDYNIRDALLTGSNRLTLNRFNLGDRVNDSPVISAPVKLGVALLKNRDGQINISVPVEGNLRNPEFELKQVINQAMGNAFGKVLRSPFGFLAGIVGARAADLRSIDFHPGKHELSNQASANLEALASALRKRPQVQLEIRPVWAEADRRWFARQKLNEKLGEQDASKDLVESREMLERLFDRTFSSEQRQSLLEQHTDRPEGTLSTVLDRDAYLNELYDRLLNGTELDNTKLIELANQRAEIVRASLRDRGITANRLYVLDHKQLEDNDQVVSLPLELSTE